MSELFKSFFFFLGVCSFGISYFKIPISHSKVQGNTNCFKLIVVDMCLWNTFLCLHLSNRGRTV